MKSLTFFLGLISAAALVVSQVFFFNKPIKNPSEVLTVIDRFFQSVPNNFRYMKEGYSPLGRSPVVDLFLSDPLYMPAYAETISQLIHKASEENSLFSLETSLFRAGGIPLAQMSKDEALKSDKQIPKQFLDAFEPIIASKIHDYWLTFMEVQREAETILGVLSREEKVWLKENYNRFFFGSQDGDADYQFFTTDSPYPLQFFELASRIDLAKLADCARRLSVLSDDFYQFRNEFDKVILKENFIWEENGLTFVVSQESHSTHEENADFFIDLGGYNAIHGNAGGTEGVRSLALHIDLKGNNTYHGANFVQGSGFLGVGLLFSCRGNNTYSADSYSQGCGFFGTGALVNLEGNNHFVLNFGGQSFALFGSSILWNKEGKNEYLANQGMAQGASSTLGVSFLVDDQGSNSYLCGIPGKGVTSRDGGIGQGGASGVRGYPWLNNPSLYGGLAILYIGGGNNKLRTVWLGQGSGYFLSAGLMILEGSDDIVEADFDAQGQGLHLAGGLLLRKGENGYFKGGFGSLGVSGDQSVGMFINVGGNNHFEGTDQSIGSSRKQQSVGMFLNIGGHNTYVFQQLSNARLQFPQSPKEWSSALFLEVGDRSRFPEDVDEFIRGTDLEWGIENHSAGVSVQTLGENSGDILFTKFHDVPKISFPFDPLHGWPDNTSYRPLVYHPKEAQELADEILSANYDRRRQIYETLDLLRFRDRKIEYDLSYLLKNPSRLPEDAFNYAVLWAFRNKDRVDLKEIKSDLQSGKFTSEYARRMAVSLVGTFWTPDAIPILGQIMLEDRSDDTRYYAALALSLHLSDDTIDILRKGVKSNSELVRYAIAKGLQESKNPNAIELASSLFNDESFYVRRAAGLTAISLKSKEGIPVVLETLQYETLDTGENYGDNIYNQLSFYLGVNFGLDRQAWINWWSENKNNFQFPSYEEESSKPLSGV